MVVHYGMDVCVLHHILVRSNTRRHSAIRTKSSPVPDAAYVCAGNDLREATSFDMPDFDESWIKKQEIWRVERHRISCALPFYNASFAARHTRSVHIDAEFYDIDQFSLNIGD